MTKVQDIKSDDELRESFDILCKKIAEKDGLLQAFVAGTCSQGHVFEQVDNLIKRFPNRDDRPPLFGLPVGVKDIFQCEGFITKCGSNLPHHLFQGSEAETVTRLKAAGAVIMGKTATTEFAYFAPASTRNPFNTAHTPGGSSSGSAAGVAAGFFDYALGTQTVGSVIRPASYCGVAGFKPSFGRLSTDGVVAFSWTVDHVGILGRTVSGLEPLISVLADGWENKKAPDQIKLGIPIGPYFNQADKTTLASFYRQVKSLENSGCDITEIACLNDIKEINNRHAKLISAEIARVHATWFKEHENQYQGATREIIANGLEVGENELTALRPSCLELRDIIHELMKQNQVDALICPSTTSEAPLGLESTGSPLMNLPWTHAGLPAITIPAGNGPNGLPLGLQLVGKFADDEFLLAISVKIESML